MDYPRSPTTAATAVEAVERLLMQPALLAEQAKKNKPPAAAAAALPANEPDTPPLREEEKPAAAAAASATSNINSKKRTATESINDQEEAAIPKYRKVMDSSTHSSVVARGVDTPTSEEELWNQRFELLCEYHRVRGHCRVPKSFQVESVELGKWVIQERCYYKSFMAQRTNGNKSAASITQKRIDRLNMIGFEWSIERKASRTDHAAWDRKFQFLWEYHNENGHCRVPQRYVIRSVKLGKWVKKQRDMYKLFLTGKRCEAMTQERIDRLNLLGFDWNLDPVAAKTDHAAWNRKFELLKEFQRQNGHCRIPQSYVVDSVKLGCWAFHQREYHKKFMEGRGQISFTQERIDKLNSIGFEWRAVNAATGKTGPRIRSGPVAVPAAENCDSLGAK